MKHLTTLAAFVLLGCAGTSLRTAATTPHRAPMTTRAPGPNEVARVLTSFRGATFVQFGDRTLGRVSTWSDGTVSTDWRTATAPIGAAPIEQTLNVLTSDGEVVQLGDTLPEAPRPEFRVEGSVDVAVGFHWLPCALLGSGAVRCPMESHLGQGAVAEAVYNSLGPLQHIYSATSCGLRTDDTLVCATGEDGPPTVVAEHVLDASLVSDGGWSASGCAVLGDHTVHCWGSNLVGRRGGDDGARVPGLDHIVRVACSHDKSCALRDDGIAFCWGQNFGPDFVEATRSMPRCATETRRVELEPCPPVPPEGDDVRGRMRFNDQRPGGGPEQVVLFPHTAPCLEPGQTAHTSVPTTLTVASDIVDLVAGDGFLWLIRSNRRLVLVRGEDAREITISAVPNRPH